MKIPRIDADKCNGCGLCVEACHEGAMAMKDGKAFVVNPSMCDGFGDCLPVCPADAIELIDVIETNILPSAFTFWPIKLQLVPERMPSLDGKNAIFVADCAGFVYSFLGMNTIIACPKLGVVDENKLKAIIEKNDIVSVKVYRMEVPCCSMLASKVEKALKDSGKCIPFDVKIITRNGKIIDSQ